MAKKNLLKANLKRPSLKREMKVTEEKMEEVVQKVADNPPAEKAAPEVSAKGKNTALVSDPASRGRGSTKPAERARKKNSPAAKAPASAPKRGRGRPKKENAAPAAPRSVHPKEGTKRLTLDIPQDLHKRLKLLAIHQEISMKDYIIQVVERSLQ